MASSQATSTETNQVTITSAPAITSFPFNPLTTTFTPPSDCEGIYSTSVNVIADDNSCLPPGFNRSTTAYFSPGVVCPSGYWSACHDTTGVASITTVNCCPMLGDLTLSCDPGYPTFMWSTFACTWEASSSTDLAITLSSNGVTSTTMSAFTQPQGVNALGVRMVYESTDMSSFSAMMLTSTAVYESTDMSSLSAMTLTWTASSSAAGLSTGFGAGTYSTLEPTERGELSAGAIAAIAIAVTLVVLAQLGALYFWNRRRRQRAGREAVPTGLSAYCHTIPVHCHHDPGAPMPADPSKEPTQYNEPQELPWDPSVAELPGERYVHTPELPVAGQ